MSKESVVIYGPTQCHIEYDEATGAQEAHLHWPREGLFKDEQQWPSVVTGPFGMANAAQPPAPLSAMEAMLRIGLSQEEMPSEVTLDRPLPNVRTAILARTLTTGTAKVSWRRMTYRPFNDDLHYSNDEERYWYCSGRGMATQGTLPEQLAALFALDMTLSWMVRIKNKTTQKRVEDSGVAFDVDLIAVLVESPHTWARFDPPISIRWIETGATTKLQPAERGESQDELKWPWLVMRRCRRVSKLMWNSIQFISAETKTLNADVSLLSRLKQASRVMRQLGLLTESRANLPSTLAQWNDIQDQRKTLADLTRQIQELKTKGAEQLISFQEVIRRRDRLEQLLSEATDNMQKVSDERGRLQQQLAKLDADHTRLTQALTASQQRETQAQSRRAEMEANLEQITLERNRLQKRLTSTQQSLDQAQEQVKQQTEEHNQWKSKADALTIQVTDLERRVAVSVSDATRIQQDLKLLTEERDRAQNEAANLKSQLDAVTAARDQLALDVQGLKDTVAATEKKLSDLTTDRDQQANQVTALQQIIQDLTVEMDKQQKMRDQLRKEAADATQELTDNTARWNAERQALQDEIGRLEMQTKLLEDLKGKLTTRMNRTIQFEDAFPFVFSPVKAPLDDMVDLTFKRVSSPLDWSDSLYGPSPSDALGRVAPLSWDQLMPGFDQWNLIVRFASGVKKDVATLQAILDNTSATGRVKQLQEWQGSLSERQTHTLWARGASFYGRTWRVRHQGRMWNAWLMWRSNPIDEPYAMGPSPDALVWGPGYPGSIPLPRVGFMDVFAEGPWKFDATCTFQLDPTLTMQTLEWNLGDARRIVLSTQHGGILDQLWIMVRS